MGVSCSSLIFFNIESPLKSSSFLLNKIRNFIKFKKTKFLKLGDINAYRDFSWAPEIMMGVYYASKLTTQDIIFSSGKTFLIKDMVKYFFHINKLSYENFVVIDKKLYTKASLNMISQPSSIEILRVLLNFVNPLQTSINLSLHRCILSFLLKNME